MTKDQTLLSIARSYVYGLGATFADLEEAVRSAVEPKPPQNDAQMVDQLARQGCTCPFRAIAESGIHKADCPVSLIVTAEQAKSPAAFRHWSKDFLVPYDGCHCSTCSAQRTKP